MSKGIGLILAFALALAASPARAGIVFNDSDFANWTFGAHGNTIASAVLEAANGNPGARVAISTSTSSGTAYGHAFKNDYSTTQILNGLTFTLTLDVLAGPGIAGAGQAVRLIVEQNGTLYALDLGTTGVRNVFTTLSFNGTLTAANFTRIAGAGPLQPNFAGGVTTRFGFAAGNSFSNPNNQYYDNVKLDLSGVPGLCVGFIDVLDVDAACLSVAWLRNRAITLGCATTEYCPLLNVSRAQMALFMNRLGKALTPVVLHKQASLANQVLGAALPGTLACATDDFPVTGYPRSAQFAGTITAQASGGAGGLQAHWRFSTDAGATWNPVGTLNTTQFPALASAGAAGQVAATGVQAPPLALSPGTTYRFGIFVDGRGATPTFNPLVCQAEVTITASNIDAP